MYKVYYDDEFYLNMANFSNYLKEYFFKLYTDTGIIDEQLILDTYENSINLLQKHIFDNIEDFCKKWLIWRKITKGLKNYEEWCFYIKINSYKIKADFNLYKDIEEVIIKSLKINT